MFKQLRYPVRVWLFSLLVGSAIYWICDSLNNWHYTGEYVSGSNPIFFAITLGMSLLCSLPCLILFTVTFNYLMNTKLTEFTTRLIVFLMSEVFIMFYIYLLIDNGNHNSIFSYIGLIVPFSIAAGVSIWICKFSKVPNMAQI
jgi:hypothetical protein